MKVGSSISPPGQASGEQTFSSMSGVAMARRAVMMFFVITSTASCVKGRGADWPRWIPPARVKPMCSLHQGGFKRRIRLAIFSR